MTIPSRQFLTLLNNSKHVLCPQFSILVRKHSSFKFVLDVFQRIVPITHASCWEYTFCRPQGQ